MWTPFASAVLGILSSYSVVETTHPVSLVHGSNGRFYAGGGALQWDGSDSSYRLQNIQVHEYRLNQEERTSLLQEKLASLLEKQVNDSTTTGEKGFHVDNLLQDRWLIARASSWSRQDQAVRIYVVIDTLTKRSFSFNGYPDHTRLTNLTVGAAGADWAVLNIEPAPVTGPPGHDPADEPARMVLMEANREINLGYGRALGADTQGRIYATETLTSDGKPTASQAVGTESYVKVRERGTWRRVGEGALLQVLPDGTFLAKRRVNDTSAHFIVKNGKWNLVPRVWDSTLHPYSLAQDGTILLTKMTMPEPGSQRHRPHFAAAILREGKVASINDMLPSAFEMNQIPTLSVDGVVVVSGQIGTIEKSFVIRPN